MSDASKRLREAVELALQDETTRITTWCVKQLLLWGGNIVQKPGGVWEHHDNSGYVSTIKAWGK